MYRNPPTLLDVQRKLHPCCENYFVLIHRLICVIAASCDPKRFMIAVHDSMATIQWLVVLESLINLQNTSSHDHLTNNLKVDNGAFNHQGILPRQQQIKGGCPSQEQSSDRRRPAWLTGTGSGAMHGRCFVLLACTINQHWSQSFGVGSIIPSLVWDQTLGDGEMYRWTTRKEARTRSLQF